MKTASSIAAALALLGTIVPAILFAFKVMGDGPMKATMLIASVVWFAAAPFCLKGGEN